MQRRSFIRVVGGGVIGAATLSTTGISGCSSFLPSEAIQAWQGPTGEALTGDARHWLLSYAILAPHSHNLQSWVADLDTPSEITLRCDLKRLLPQTDPLSRQIMMSHGTFLELLDIAARERGLRADMALFPEGAFGPEKLDNRAVARIRLTPDATVQKDALFAQILRRRTNRSRYDVARAVPLAAWNAMAASVDPAMVRFDFTGSENLAALAAQRKLALQAWKIELTTPRTIMESYNVLRVGATEIAAHRDGLSLTAPVPVLLAQLGLFDRTRAPAPDDYATTSQISDFGENLNSTPGFFWFVTSNNDRVTQVNAGRAYARMQLAATAHGLSMQPLSQALQEYPEQKVPYAEIHHLAGATQPGNTVQMWARVGFAPEVEPAPRRKLQDFIRSSV
jgi:hypothetical protein